MISILILLIKLNRLKKLTLTYIYLVERLKTAWRPYVKPTKLQLGSSLMATTSDGSSVGKLILFI